MLLFSFLFIFEFLNEEGTPESVNPSVVDKEEVEEEEGLPSPPLDVGAFFATQPTSMELSQVLFLILFHLFFFIFIVKRTFFYVCGLIGIIFPLSLVLHYMKFFDGMDDDGSELNLLSLMLLLDSFFHLVLYLNSPLLRFMIMIGECCFRSSKQWGIHQEPG